MLGFLKNNVYWLLDISLTKFAFTIKTIFKYEPSSMWSCLRNFYLLLLFFSYVCLWSLCNSPRSRFFTILSSFELKHWTTLIHIYICCLKKYFFCMPRTNLAKKQNRVEKCDIPLSTALQRERESERDPPLIVCCRHSTGSWVTGKNHIYCPSKQPAWRTSLMNIRKERVSRPCATFRLNLVNY